MTASCSTRSRADDCAPIADAVAQQICYQTAELRRENRQRILAAEMANIDNSAQAITAPQQPAYLMVPEMPTYQPAPYMEPAPTFQPQPSFLGRPPENGPLF
jgi:hypothetical protein